MNTIADTLRVVQPHLSPDLVSAAPREAVASLAAQLPATLSNWGYLECRLGEEESRVDLILRIDANGRDILSGRNPAVRLPTSFLANPMWARIHALTRQEAPASARRPCRTRMLWLEFDVDPDPGGCVDSLSPGVFLGLRPPAGTDGSAADARSLVDVIAQFFDGAVPGHVEQGVARCQAALPAGAFLAYVGLFPHRSDSAVRLCVAGLDSSSVVTYLRAAGWRGAEEEVRACLAEIHRSRRRAWAPEPMLLHLDVGAGVGTRVGLEYVCAHRPQIREGVAETGFLHHLEALGLCTPAKRNALLRWPGYTVERLPHELWRSLLVRRLNHVKLVIGTSCVPEAKAYLSFHHVPRRRREEPRL